MLAVARVALKLHRVEVGLASALAILVAAAVSFLDAGSMSTLETYIWSTMSLLPFGLGLLTGVPIVSRELEERTAQVAWSLNGSRARWLFRQSSPILLVLIAAIAVTAWTTTALVNGPDAHPEGAFVNIGSYGVPVLARAFGAFGLGIFVGALIGRALPALVFGGVLSLGLVLSVSGARDAWLAAQAPSVPIEGVAGFIQKRLGNACARWQAGDA